MLTCAWTLSCTQHINHVLDIITCSCSVQREEVVYLAVKSANRMNTTYTIRIFNIFNVLQVTHTVNKM